MPVVIVKKCVYIHLSILIQLHTWCTACVCIYMPANRIKHASPYEKEILIPRCTCFLPWLSFFASFSFSGWANVVVWSFQMLIIGNSAQHKGTSSYFLLQVASDPLSTEGFGQKISSKKTTLAASKTDLEMMSQFDTSVNYILTYPSIYIPIIGLPSDLHHKSSKALATETKPERLERLDVSP